MAWYPDLGTVTQIDRGAHVRAVGWLSAAQPFPLGDVSTECLGRLLVFARHWQASVKALGWGISMGWHDCEWCSGATATGNFGVPRRGLLYVAPQMLPHYIEVHHYRPPDQFLVALMESPVPGSAEYQCAVEPFRRLHEQYRERQQEERFTQAVRWARDRGGGEESVRQALLMFFGEPSPDSERIRQVLQAMDADRTRS
jgi:hypothetical protein